MIFSGMYHAKSSISNEGIKQMLKNYLSDLIEWFPSLMPSNLLLNYLFRKYK